MGEPLRAQEENKRQQEYGKRQCCAPGNQETTYGKRRSKKSLLFYDAVLSVGWLLVSLRRCNWRDSTVLLHLPAQCVEGLGSDGCQMTSVEIKLTEFSDLVTRYTADFVGRR